MSEQELIDQLQNSIYKNQAFRVLLKEYKKPVYLFVRKMVIDHQDTDDIVQQTFIKVFKYVDSFKGNSKFSTWILTIARKEAIQFLKNKASRHKKSIDDLTQQHIAKLSVHSEFYSGNDIQYKLQYAVAQLPEKQREVFNMKYFDKLKYSEIAKITGTTEGGLKANYSLAVKRLKELLLTV